MAAYYLDTSALVKRYITEDGTVWLRQLFEPAQGHEFFIVRVTGPEFIAALQRRVRTKDIRMMMATRLSNTFRTSWQRQYRIIEVNEQVTEQAMNIAQQYQLRGYDAVQLAAALHVNALRVSTHMSPLIFVSSDTVQLSVAVALGFQVENPAHHV
jgi:predicted nucleic acid-binding protein